MIKVVATDGLDKEAVEILHQSGLVDFVLHKEVAKENLLSVLSDADAVVIRSATKITANVLSALPKLKFVIRAGVGIDNVDLVAAAKNGVLVWNAPTGNFQSTAELAIAHLFSLARKVPLCVEAARKGEWIKKEVSASGRQIQGMTLGIYGAGNIGNRVASMATALGMKVLICDPFYKGSLGEVVDFETLLKKSDAITIHAPFMDSTKYKFNFDAFTQMKPNAFIINVARGGIIKDEDLLRALVEKKIAGAGLDVFEVEPTPADSPLYSQLLKLPQVVSTPHVGAATIEAQKAVGLETADRILAVAERLLKNKKDRALPPYLNSQVENPRIHL